MELWVPGACQAPKASSPNPSRCPIILPATLPISQGGKLILTCNTTSKPVTAENVWLTREKSFWSSILRTTGQLTMLTSSLNCKSPYAC